MSIKISVVIPTHNRIEGLHTTLRSLLEQTHLPDEVIVTDDGSNPAVDSSIFDVFPEKVKCVLLRNEQPKGGNNARNQGVMAASGDYIAFLDDDDQFKPNKIEVLRKKISTNSDVDVFYHPAHVHMPDENISYISKPQYFEDPELFCKSLLVKNFIGGTPMVVIRRSKLIEIGGFDENMPALQDYELWIRLALNASSFYLIDLPLTDYEQRTKKKSITKNKNAIGVARSLIDEKHKEHYDEVLLFQKSMIQAKTDILRHILNDESYLAFKKSLSSFVSFKKIEFFLSGLLLVLGRNNYLKVYFGRR